MTQFVEQLRNQAKWYAQPGHNARDLMDSHLLEKAADEIECLRAKIAEMERQEPVAWMLNCPTLGGDTGWVLSWTQSGAGLCNRLSGEENEKKLYALPGAQPATSIPDDVMRDAKRYRFLRAAKNIPISTEAARDPVVYDAAIDAAMLARAPEAKP